MRRCASLPLPALKIFGMKCNTLWLRNRELPDPHAASWCSRLHNSFNGSSYLLVVNIEAFAHTPSLVAHPQLCIFVLEDCFILYFRVGCSCVETSRARILDHPSNSMIKRLSTAWDRWNRLSGVARVQNLKVLLWHKKFSKTEFSREWKMIFFWGAFGVL